jgi:hypothetical protein
MENDNGLPLDPDEANPHPIQLLSPEQISDAEEKSKRWIGRYNILVGMGDDPGSQSVWPTITEALADCVEQYRILLTAARDNFRFATRRLARQNALVPNGLSNPDELKKAEQSCLEAWTVWTTLYETAKKLATCDKSVKFDWLSELEPPRTAI